MYVTTTKSVEFSTSGLSVVGIAMKILEYMDTQKVQYPSQYSLTVDDNKVTITRKYQENV